MWTARPGANREQKHGPSRGPSWPGWKCWFRIQIRERHRRGAMAKHSCVSILLFLVRELCDDFGKFCSTCLSVFYEGSSKIPPFHPHSPHVMHLLPITKNKFFKVWQQTGLFWAFLNLTSRIYLGQLRDRTQDKNAKSQNQIVKRFLDYSGLQKWWFSTRSCPKQTLLQPTDLTQRG